MKFFINPTDFKANFTIVSCFLEYEDEILLVKRASHKPQPNTWGQPAGKTNKSERLIYAMIRELSEEIGHKVKKSQLEYIQFFNVRYPDVDFIYHVYIHKLKNKPNIKINSEELVEYVWITPKKALDLDLILAEDHVIRTVYNLKDY